MFSSCCMVGCRTGPGRAGRHSTAAGAASSATIFHTFATNLAALCSAQWGVWGAFPPPIAIDRSVCPFTAVRAGRQVAMAFPLGAVVRVAGLTGSSQLNGMVGVVFRAKGDRVCVQLLGMPKKIEVLPVRLQAVDVTGWGLPPAQCARVEGERGGSDGTAAGAPPAGSDSEAMAAAATGAAVVAPQSLFALPAVQASLGGLARTQQLLQRFLDPLQRSPANPRVNLDFANFVLSVMVGLRATGVFVPAFPEYAQAAAAYEVAVAAGDALFASPRERSENLIKRGLFYQSGGELENAVDSLQAGCDADPSNESAFSLFSYCLEITGDYERALANCRKALELNPMHADALSRLCAHTKVSSVDDDTFKMVLAATAAADAAVGSGGSGGGGGGPAQQQRVEPKEHSILHYTLAKLQTGLGLLEEAVGSLQRANAIATTIPGNAFSIAAERQKAEILVGIFQPVVWGSLWDDPTFGHATAGTAASPTPIFIVGMPRSGSSLVEQILSSHPDVYGGGENTPFSPVVGQLLPLLGSKDPSQTGPLFRAAGRQYVDAMARRAGGRRFFTDKHLLNFWHIGLIHLMLPQAKVIHITRDPMDTCFSCYRHHFEPGTITFSNSLDDLGAYYNLYRETVAAFEKVVPPGMLLRVRYEDVVRDFEPTCRRAFEHCGAGAGGLEFPAAARTFWRTPRVVDTNSAPQVRRPLYRSGMHQWEPFEGVHGPDGASVLGGLRAALRQWYEGEGEGEGGKRGGGGNATGGGHGASGAGGGGGNGSGEGEP